MKDTVLDFSTRNREYTVILFWFNIISLYNSVNVQLFNSQLNKPKSKIKTVTEVTVKFSSNLIGDFNNETSFPHKLLLADRSVLNPRRSFGNNLSANIKSSNYLK